MAFQDIQFGRAAAENERDYAKNLLDGGFLDDEKLIDKLVRVPRLFVVLGPKGSGKSAIGYRLELLENRYNVNARVFRLDDFPFDGFSRIFEWPGESEDFVFRQNWDFILSLCFLHAIRRDKTAIVNTPFEWTEVDTVLQQLNIEVGTDIAEILKRISSREYGFTSKFGKAGKTDSVEFGRASLTKLKGMLEEIAFKVSPSRPIRVVLDGLDDSLTFKPSHLRCLAALLIAVSRFNSKLVSNEIDAKIIVLCRDDIWQVMETPNLQRIRDDNSVPIEWYNEGTEPVKSRLIRFLNLRASTSLGIPTDIFKDYFPRHVGWSGYGGPTMRVLLDHTRHVPRDLVNLMNLIQDTMQVKDVKPSEDQVRIAVKKYCSNHFEGEIRNSLNGLVADSDAHAAMDFLGAMQPQEFTFAKALEVAQNNPQLNINEERLLVVLSALYRACAIGQSWIDDNGKQRFSFRYRNPTSRFSPKFGCFVHPALYKALHGDIMGFVYQPLGQQTLEESRSPKSKP